MTRRSDEVFRLLELAAIAGERCPKSKPYGPLPGELTQALVAEGRIRVEIFAENWRVVTILTGPHAGASTKAAPKGGQPYRTLGFYPGFRKAG